MRMNLTTFMPTSFSQNRRRLRRSFARRLLRSTSGISMIEFGLILPVFLSLGLFGAEIAYMTTVNMQVNQIAVSVADNASRLGQTDNSSVTPTVTEADIDSVMQGALHQGENFNFQEQGRIILSSFERDSDTNKQFIHWQRCSGDLDKESDYGEPMDGLTGDEILALGKAGKEVTVEAGMAVMFVEVYYRYEGLFSPMFIDDLVFKQEAAFLIRDDRNLMNSNEPGITGTGGSSHCT